MANERKTEQIVRSHFQKFSNQIFIEEQISENPTIAKLLKTASKKGHGKGSPEFLISLHANSELLIVVECKSDIRKHESANRDKRSDYAVDGVLLYASYLSKQYDVLAIAVSGEDIGNCRVSHFLQLKDERRPVQVFGDRLLSIDDYLSGYLRSPEKFRQDYNKLLLFTKKLNETLHTNKILESQRSLLISCVLIALEYTAFKEGYRHYDNPKDLSNYLVDTVINSLKSANIQGEKLENLGIQFSFIRTDTSLSTKKQVLKGLIKDIDENINQFIKTHEYFDVLGQLYIEFLRYANSDKGLGIVLTPPHITELFAELAQVNKNSVVYDNCAGTGGFLISAMKRMMEDAKGDDEVIANIKSKQLIGTEYQAHIFALAVSNMYIHHDGKTNIIKGSCFEDEIIKEVTSLKPTVGLLNPPYKSDKKKDIDELEFVLNNLSCLVDGGTCVAIVPMQSALSQRGKILEYKRRLLEKHTLEAVLSMPDELFFNSNVGVVSCIMIFTAHRPHPKNKETYFGYYKDDGFVKRKIQGRIDLYGRRNAIKDKRISTLQNKKNEPGFSITKCVGATDERCPEAYMYTGYDVLQDRAFEKTILDYVSYAFQNKLSFTASNEPLLKSKIKLDIKSWQFYDLTFIFDIVGSKTTPILELEEYGPGSYPYVTTQATNNGVGGFFDFFTEKGQVLTVDSAVLGYCSYQAHNFSASDHVEKLIPKFNMDKYIAMFLVTVMNLEQYRYNYGRKCSQTRMKEISIKLPSKNGQPDWQFMRDYISSLPYSSSL